MTDDLLPLLVLGVPLVLIYLNWSLRNSLVLLAGHLLSRTILDSLPGFSYSAIVGTISPLQLYTLAMVLLMSFRLVLIGSERRFPLLFPALLFIGCLALTAVAQFTLQPGAVTILRWVYLVLVTALVYDVVRVHGLNKFLIAILIVSAYPILNQGFSIVTNSPKVDGSGSNSFIGTYAHEVALSYYLLLFTLAAGALVYTRKSVIMVAIFISASLYGLLALWLCNYRTVLVAVAVYVGLHALISLGRVPLLFRIPALVIFVLAAGIGSVLTYDVVLEKIGDMFVFVLNPTDYLDFSENREYTSLMSGRISLINSYMYHYLNSGIMALVVGIGIDRGTALVGVYAHNEYVSALAETGPLGLIAFLWFCTVIAIRASLAMKQGDGAYRMLAGVPLIYLIVALGTMPFRSIQAMLVLAIAVGVGGVVLDRRVRADEAEPTKNPIQDSPTPSPEPVPESESVNKSRKIRAFKLGRIS